MEAAALPPSEAASDANDRILDVLREINVKLANISDIGPALDAIANVVETFDDRLKVVETTTREAAQTIALAHADSNGKLNEAMREVMMLERTVGKLVEPLSGLMEVQGKLLEADPGAQIKSITKTSEALTKVSASLIDMGESLATRLANIPQADKVDQNAIQKMESARLGLVEATNDIIAVAQLKRRLIDRAPNNRTLAIFTMLGVSLGSLAATVGFAVWKPGVDTHAESWGRHLLADRTFAACLDQAQAPTGPAACSIRFRPDATPAPAKR
jgi:hypothetical protein